MTDPFPRLPWCFDLQTQCWWWFGPLVVVILATADKSMMHKLPAAKAEPEGPFYDSSIPDGVHHPILGFSSWISPRTWGSESGEVPEIGHQKPVPWCPDVPRGRVSAHDLINPSPIHFILHLFQPPVLKALTVVLKECFIFHNMTQSDSSFGNIPSKRFHA